MTTTVPRIRLVEMNHSSDYSVRLAGYRSLDEADAMLARTRVGIRPRAHLPYDTLTVEVIWDDGFRVGEHLHVGPEHRAAAEAADLGLLRYLLINRAKAAIAGSPGLDLAPYVIEQRRHRGRELLRRLIADGPEPRNAYSSTWRAPSLLPDPAAAIRRLRGRFVGRTIVPAVGDGDGADRAGYPATNHADVRYVINFVSLALRTDVATLSPTAAGVIWNHWLGVKGTVETLLRAGADTDLYEDNEGLWVRQLPALVHLLDDARDQDGPLRNGRLTFRPVGGTGEPYPPWVADLRGLSGVYVIRAPGESGAPEIVYVGQSATDRLYETMTRHFQAWRRWNNFHRGRFTEGHDPGLTYDRDTSEAAAIVTPPQHALALEARLIRRLCPRDNLSGKDACEEAPF